VIDLQIAIISCENNSQRPPADFFPLTGFFSVSFRFLGNFSAPTGVIMKQSIDDGLALAHAVVTLSPFTFVLYGVSKETMKAGSIAE